MTLAQSQSLLEVLASLVGLVELQERDARVLVSLRVRGVDLDRPRENRERLRRPARIRQRDPERIEGLGVVALPVRGQHSHGFHRPAHLRQEQTPAPIERLAARPPGGGPLAGFDRRRQVPPRLQNRDEVHVAEPHLRILVDHLPGDLQRLVVTLHLVRVDETVDLLIHDDEVLGIVGRTVGRLHLRGAGQVAEASQLGGLLRADRAALGHRGRKLHQPLAQTAERVRPGSHQVLLLRPGPSADRRARAAGARCTSVRRPSTRATAPTRD